jgi:hypothetical protein
MPTDETSQSEVETFSFNQEQFRIEIEELFSAHRTFLDDTKTSIQIATDANKQISSFFERIMLLDLGAIGLSITALTSVGGKLGNVPHRNVVVTLAAVGWLLLFGSSLLCRTVMLGCIHANKRFSGQWIESTAAYHRPMIELIVSRVSRTFQGSVRVADKTVDPAAVLKALFSVIQTKEFPDPETTTKKLQALLANDNASSKASGKMGMAAMVCMQFGFVSLGLAAIVLVVGFG